MESPGGFVFFMTFPRKALTNAVFLLILLFFLFDLFNFKDSYGYVDCGNDVIYPQGINTLNLRDYINRL